MLIDWVTARAPFDAFSAADWDKLRLLGDRIQRLDPRTGELRWETSAWDSIRSDSHGLSYRCGSDAFWFQGSPARVIGDGDNTFSSGAAAALDLAGCVRRMRDFVLPVLGVSAPPVERCVVSRVDVTANLLLSGPTDVRAALAVLRNCEGGRYRVSQQAGDTVYWGGKSRLMKGKAYAKGPHLEYQLRNKNYRGPEYSPEQLMGANALLRLECTIGAQWWRERAGKHWLEITAEDLKNKWANYFHRMLGTSEITEMNVSTLLQLFVGANSLNL
ncbi:phage/plasmid replication domain-containing protein [Thiocystis minor]|uniref:phage/plasmid replication domain-containing protein n=1 Tax=Thiocystis minor TaxID=61597 RepID=UPI001913E156